MTTLTVEQSWNRIETWLERHAAVSHGLLRPPALPQDIAAAERRLGLTFPADLKESLLRHDGVQLQDGTLTLGYYGPLSGIEDLVRSTEFLRDVAEDLTDDEAEFDEEERDQHAYWPHERLLITLGIGWQSSDGLFLATRPGPHRGRVGRYFDEDAPSFTPWRELREVLADFATALENGTPFDGRTPLAYEGRLIWDDGTTVISDPVSPLGLAAEAAEPVVAPVPAPASGAAPTVEFADGQYAVLSFGAFGTFGAPAAAEEPPPQPDVVFVAGLTPGELLDRLGAVPATAGLRSREQARLAAAAPWAAYRPLVRAGVCGDGWSYAIQEGGDAQFGRPEVLRRLSRGTRAVRLTKEGPEVHVTVVDDGVARPEAARRVESPREDYVTGPDGQEWQQVGADPWPGSTAAYARLLAALAEEYGIHWDPAGDGDEPLASALLLPVLDDIRPTGHPVSEVREVDLAGLVDRTPPERLRSAMAAQLARLAAETGIGTYPEMAHALERTARNEPVDLGADGALDLRIRRLSAEARAARGLLYEARHDAEPAPVTAADVSAWGIRDSAAGALRAFALLPLPEAAELILSRRLSLRWRDELAADLAGR
ncbi:SMI1/KNR4 family protein [Streptomyces bambusae]|uniref:SMI1/KNR4 family protein n=1 Tax=Streptomyces bambusae TaxID=1550616 RepID=UPI001CFCA445|nr:SMI1/KNR4 family protein [Streptomyces bambusae]MCB5163924.1 SMI1/KNR4 family protein [Streptomyces bambusae]